MYKSQAYTLYSDASTNGTNMSTCLHVIIMIYHSKHMYCNAATNETDMSTCPRVYNVPVYMSTCIHVYVISNKSHTCTEYCTVMPLLMRPTVTWNGRDAGARYEASKYVT